MPINPPSTRQAYCLSSKPFIPPKGAERFNEVWPPVDLKRVVAERIQFREGAAADISALQTDCSTSRDMRPDNMHADSLETLRGLSREPQVGSKTPSFRVIDSNFNSLAERERIISSKTANGVFGVRLHPD